MQVPQMDIYESSEIFFFILKVFGLAPFGFDRKTRKVMMKSLNILQFIISIVIWTALGWAQIRSTKKQDYVSGVQSKLLDVLLSTEFLIQPFLAIGAISFSVLRRKNIEKFLESVFKFDEMFSRFGWPHKAKHLKPLFPLIWVIVLTLLLLSHLVCAFVIYDLSFKHLEVWECALSFVAFVGVGNFFPLLAMQFIFSVHCINARLSSLDRNIR